MLTVTRVFIFACLAAAAQAQTPECLHFTDMLSPTAATPFADSSVRHAGLISDDLLVVYDGTTVDIIDITDRGTPLRIGRIDKPYYGINDLVVSGQYVYCSSSNGVHVLDVSVPTAPAWVGSVATTYSWGKAAVAGDLLAVIHSDACRLHTLADPLAPAEVAVLERARGLTFLEPARLALLFEGFSVLDVSDPAQPVEINRLEFEAVLDYPQYVEHTHMRNLLVLDGLLMGRCEQVVEVGSYYNLRVTRHHSRRLFDPATFEPVELRSDPAGSGFDRYDDSVFPVLRRGDLLVDGRDVVDPGSGSLATHSRIPLVEPADEEGLLPGPGDEILCITDTGLLSLAAGDLAAPNAINVTATGDASLNCLDALANESLWVEHWWHETGGSEVRYGFESGVPAGTLPCGTQLSGIWLIDDMVVTESEAGMQLFAISEAGVAEHGFPAASVTDILDGPGPVAVVFDQDVFTLYDLTVPASPVPLGTLDLGGYSYGQYLRTSVLADRLLVNGTNVIMLVSVADPEAPVLLSIFPYMNIEWAELWTPDLATAKYDVTLWRIDFTDPGAPAVSFSVNLQNLDSVPFPSGDPRYAYVLGDEQDGGGGLLIHLIDMATLDRVGTSVLQLPQHTLCAAADGSLATAGPYNGWTAVPVACEVEAASAVAEPPRADMRLDVFPNPFNPRTSVRLEMKREGPARLDVFDGRGRRLCRYDLGDLPAGRHRITWDGRDDAGRELPSGVYLLRLTSPAGHATAKLMLVR